MAAKKSGLGKGLDSLISKNVNTDQLNHGLVPDPGSGEQVVKVRISQVEPNREQARKNFDEADLAELADSIRQYGIIQPLIVQNKGKYYEIVAGERRWRAAKLAGVKEVPVIIRDISEQQKMEMSLIENIQREDLNPIEEAKAYRQLLEEFNLKQEDVAQRVSKSRAAVANSLRLLKLCDEVQQMVIDGKLTGGHARCLISVENADLQRRLAEQIASQDLSVRETERLVRALQEDQGQKTKKTSGSDKKMDAIYADLANQMRSILGTGVEIRRKNETSGRIEISYYSQEDLDRILQMIRSIDNGNA